MGIVVDELIRRIHKIESNAVLLFKDELPLNEYLQRITNRYSIYLQIRFLEKNLEKLSDQFRVIQKRLLTRYKNKNPTPLNQMDVLLKETYQSIIGDANKLQSLNAKLEFLSHRLWNIQNLLLILMQCKFQLDDANMSILTSFLSIGTNEIAEGGRNRLKQRWFLLL